MAILKAGINGPFSGKVGSVVGYELNGQTVIRSLPAIVKTAQRIDAHQSQTFEGRISIFEIY
ncbi:hypothetical protein D3C87_1342520 [compost metagenome]